LTPERRGKAGGSGPGGPPLWLVQLPFPSTASPHPLLTAYYRDYSRKWAAALPGYFIPEGSLWEMPLWVAHLAGMAEAIGFSPCLLDLSRQPPEAEKCLAELLDKTAAGSVVLLSPLAQNFDLALAVSVALMREGRRTILGGNMAPLARPDQATLIHRGLLEPESLRDLLDPGRGGVQEIAAPRRGTISWMPSYRLLEGYAHRVPLVRLNASHGCQYGCAFCGDAWSRKLYVVERSALAAEVSEIARLFPETRLIYLGDKTFGQSKEAVENLLAVFASRRHYRFIVQTHVLRLEATLIEAMVQLGVVAVEIGFESADLDLLRRSRKASLGTRDFEKAMESLHAAGIRVVLNLLGGLPYERPSSHRTTIDTIERWVGEVWLYNIYNFVPYPPTPYFPMLRERIFNWDFRDWREDAPPVFTPFHLSPAASWELFLDKVETAHRAILAADECAAAFARYDGRTAPPEPAAG
jgi:hypothetical protein